LAALSSFPPTRVSVADAEKLRPTNHQVSDGADLHHAWHAAAHDLANQEVHAAAALLPSTPSPVATVCARPRCQLRHSCRSPTTNLTRQASVARFLGAGTHSSNAPIPGNCSTEWPTYRKSTDCFPGANPCRIPFRRLCCLSPCPCHLLLSQHLNFSGQQGPAGWQPPVRWTGPALSCSQLLSPGSALAPWGRRA